MHLKPSKLTSLYSDLLLKMKSSFEVTRHVRRTKTLSVRAAMAILYKKNNAGLSPDILINVYFPNVY